MTAPCKECPDRHRACHDSCEKYQEFKRWREQVLEKARRAKEADTYEFERNEAIRRRRHI